MREARGEWVGGRMNSAVSIRCVYMGEVRVSMPCLHTPFVSFSLN